MIENIYSQENSKYLEKNKSWHIEDSAWKAKQIMRMIQKHSLKPRTVAEVGCGAGEILSQLKSGLTDKSIEFYGYDIAPDVIPFWKEREQPRLHFFHENLLEKDIFVDVLLMIDVFEHVEDYLGFIKRCQTKATLKIYHIPLDISVTSIIRNMPIKARKSVGHIHYFMKETALASIRDCGQEVIDYTYTFGAIDLESKFRTRVLNVFRKIVYKMNQDIAANLFGGYSLLVLAK